jgi:hypothetical protein
LSAGSAGEKATLSRSIAGSTTILSTAGWTALSGNTFSAGSQFST